MLIRKSYDELISNHVEQLFRENPDLYKFYNKGDKMLNLPNGSTIRFRHLQHPSDVYNYQGQEFDFIGIDELTQHQKETFTILRSSNRTIDKTIKPRMILTGNPGGIGHGWVRKLFIVNDYEPGERPEDFHFVSAKVSDNMVLMENDPDYIQRLEALPEDIRRAYLDGDWDVFQGQFFQEWNREVHVIKPFPLYPNFKRFISVDYGYNAPSSVHWYAIDYSGRVIVYRELYETGLTFYDLGFKIAKMTPGEEQKESLFFDEKKALDYLTFDPSLQSKSSESGVSGEDRLREGLRAGGLHCGMIPANNNRKYGWGIMREFMKIVPDSFGGMTSNIVWFNTCTNAIRTIPEQIYDPIRMEDLDSDGEDHVVDETRYALVSVKIRPTDKDRKIKKPMSLQEKSFYDRMRKLKARSVKKGGSKFDYIG